MKLSTAVLFGTVARGLDVGPKALPERYLYDEPVCGSIQECADNNGCNGAVLSESSGVVEILNYQSRFSCRWEIKGGSNSKIKIRFVESSNFGIETQPSCGFDKVHVQDATAAEDNHRLARICSAPANVNRPYNGLSAGDSQDGKKIKGNEWREGIELDTNHVVIAFDTDQDGTGNGFTMEYEIIGDLFDDSGDVTEETFAETIAEEAAKFYEGPNGESLDDLLAAFPQVRAEKLGGRVEQQSFRVGQISSRMMRPEVKCRTKDISKEFLAETSRPENHDRLFDMLLEFIDEYLVNCSAERRDRWRNSLNRLEGKVTKLKDLIMDAQ